MTDPNPDTYERRLIRIRPRSWPSVIREITATGAEAVEKAGGQLFGLFVGQIGLAANEGIILTFWPDAAEKRESPVLTGAMEGVESTVEQLVATVRPREPASPSEPGVYAHRSFEIQEKDWPEFLALSEGAWPTFEAAFGAEVLGFWRSLEVEPPKARVYLLTRYPDLATWERSRMTNTQDPGEQEARKRFVRRHELTDFTVVVTTQLFARPR
jgi:hypothetical protein